MSALVEGGRRRRSQVTAAVGRFLPARFRVGLGALGHRASDGFALYYGLRASLSETGCVGIAAVGSQ